VNRVGPRETMFEIVYDRVSGVPYLESLTSEILPEENIEVSVGCAEEVRSLSLC
jgi:hypothetical protein